MIFWCDFFKEKVQECCKKNRYAFIHVNAFMDGLCVCALFEFNSNSSAESYLNTNVEMAQKT